MITQEEINLAKALKSGDKDAFYELYNQFVRRIFHFVHISIKSYADCEELVQVIFVKIWENHSNINPEKSISSYLYTVAKNCIINYYKKNIYIQAFEANSQFALTEEEDTIIKEIISNDLNKRLNQLIRELPKKRKEIFLLSRVYHMTYHEIAKKMGISENTVDTQMRLALNYLRSKVFFF